MQKHYSPSKNQTAIAAEPASIQEAITLKKDVSALEIVRKENLAGHFGVLAQISKGSKLEICGTGFNERTYKVRFQDRLFFVFSQDLGFEPRYAF
ncbi:MAG: hypothetical protein ACJ74Y_02390 [Bryobacteraceae bacterium]